MKKIRALEVTHLSSQAIRTLPLPADPARDASFFSNAAPKPESLPTPALVSPILTNKLDSRGVFVSRICKSVKS